MIRRGRTRFVVLCGSVAFKVAIGERGLRCNQFEANLYKRVNAQRREMLCPVIWCAPAGSVLIARRADRELTCACGSVAEKVLKVSTGGRIFLWSDRGAPHSTPCPTAPDDDLPPGKHIVWGDEAKPPVFGHWPTALLYGLRTAFIRPRLGQFLNAVRPLWHLGGDELGEKLRKCRPSAGRSA
jgi:hypothetical protein